MLHRKLRIQPTGKTREPTERFAVTRLVVMMVVCNYGRLGGVHFNGHAKYVFSIELCTQHTALWLTIIDRSLMQQKKTGVRWGAGLLATTALIYGTTKLSISPLSPYIARVFFSMCIDFRPFSGISSSFTCFNR